jgi:hypothetical protein
MHLSTNIRRLTAAVLLGSFVLAASAPVAEAGNGGKGRKYKRHHAARVHHTTHRTVVRHVHTHDCGVPTLAGFVGGLIVGAAVSSAYAAPPPPPPPPQYYYYDPYCDVRYSSIDACTPHFRACHHPRTVRVIDVRSGHSVDRWTWYHGRWHDNQEYAYHDD